MKKRRTHFTNCFRLFMLEHNLTPSTLARTMGEAPTGRVCKMALGTATPTMGFVDKVFDKLQMPKQGEWYEKLKRNTELVREARTFALVNFSPAQCAVIEALCGHLHNMDDSECADLTDLIKHSKESKE